MQWLAVSKLLSNSAIALLITLPFILFFGTFRNIDAQAGILLIAGSLSWLSIAMSWLHWRIKRLPAILLGIFIVAACLSFLMATTKTYGLFGAPFVRIGFFSFIAYIGCATLITKISYKKFIVGPYSVLLAMAVVAIPYALLVGQPLFRLGGTVAQADILACFMACGLVLGYGLFTVYPARSKWLHISQSFLAVILILTGTRAVLAIMICFGLVFMYQRFKRCRLWLLAGLVFILIGLFLFLQFTQPQSIVDDSKSSLTYRLDLQIAAIESSTRHFFFGYGPGNEADALQCHYFTSYDLKRTCQEGYFFNSSHNIYLDRVLGLGWIGGLSFLTFICAALYHGFSGNRQQRLIACCGLVIALYYLTNVTSNSLELLLWICSIQLLSPLIYSEQPEPSHASA